MTSSALPGYQAVADDAARFVQKHKETLKLDDAVLAGLEQGLAEVKRLFRRLKGFRRIFTRFDKLDVMFIGFVVFAVIVIAIK